MILYIFAVFLKGLKGLKKYLLFVWLFSIFSYSNAQTRGLSKDVGFFFGGAYYMGELNSSKQFYNLNPTYGLMIRKNYNMSYSLSYHIYYGSLSAKDADSKYLYQKMRNYSFRTKIYDCSVLGEFNFLPFKIGEETKPFSPFTFVGLSFYNTQSPRFAIPFGVGIKANIAKRFALEIEWSFKKTQNDVLDNTSGKDLPKKPVLFKGFGNKQTGYFNNNDWYSFFGFYLVYKFSEESHKCRAYFD